KDKTIMFSSHIMQEVEAVCDRIIIIDKGNIVKDDKIGGDGVKDKTQSVIVEFDVEVSNSELSKIEGILQVESIAPSTYRLVSNSGGDLRKSISEWARSKDRLILALQFEDHNLEDVFRKHTS
ncbi:gliding motility-associated ABC transporter ATP-binding subunit GldA, partial [bacterium]|nr:gliding motility-associated ABC transporter ATP-binding subunit GldA [bacterium]